MPFIDTPIEHHFPWYVRLFFWNQKRRYGAVLEPARLWGRSPRVFVPLALLYGALDRRSSPIEPTLRSLVIVRVSQINWCAFCVDINSANVLKRGVEQAKLSELATFESSTRFTEREKAAVLWAEAVTTNRAQKSGDVYERVKAQFSTGEIVELTLICAMFNMINRINDSLDIDIEDQPEIDKIQGSLVLDPERLSTYLHWLADNWLQDFDAINQQAEDAAA